MSGANSTTTVTGAFQDMGLFEAVNTFFGKVRRVGFYLYVGLVVGSLGWTFWEMSRLNRQLERKRERDAEREKDQNEPERKRSHH